MRPLALPREPGTLGPDTMSTRTITVPEESAGLRLDVFLASVLADRSPSQIQRLIKDQHVQVTGRNAKANQAVKAGQTVAVDIPAQVCITRDNVQVGVDGVLYLKVLNPERASYGISDYLFAISQLAQTTLRSILGQAQLDDLLAERDRLNQQLQHILDEHAEPWGIKVSAVEVKNVDLPQEMQRAIARQAEAERERRAKVIHAEGEFQAAQRLTDAANVMSQNPVALQLRYLQTLVEIAAEKNSTTIFPIPIDILTPFIKSLSKQE